MEKLQPKLFNWGSILDPQTRAQAEQTSRLPFIHPHLAPMPDAHLGLGATVGSVIPTLGAVIPAAVGVDIGCGMIAVRTQLTEADLPTDRRPVREAVERAIPLSAGAGDQAIAREHTRDRVAALTNAAVRAEFDPARFLGQWDLQLGTLGSGNHFIEITRDETGLVVPAFGLSGCRQQDRPAPHRRRADALRAVVDSLAAQRPFLPRGRHRRVLGLHPADALGADLRPAQP
ncbi:hypothetical protein GCM10009810_24790 [Nostocoides vanveenii]|uniref:3'-phosphate/5'-hydroxy nucleic acid ligase n=1 Tax=Nostocoides vanveenii TaxID=330835 RepID=A0ABN2KV36_9MICO